MMIIEAVDAVTNQFDKPDGIVENMETVRHLGDELYTKIEKILLADRRRREEPEDFVWIRFSKREIEFILWASGTSSSAADRLASELNVAQKRLVEAFNHVEQEKREAA